MIAITSVTGNPNRVTELVKKKKENKKAGSQYRPDKKRPVQFRCFSFTLLSKVRIRNGKQWP